MDLDGGSTVYAIVIGLLWLKVGFFETGLGSRFETDTMHTRSICDFVALDIGLDVMLYALLVVAYCCTSFASSCVARPTQQDYGVSTHNSPAGSMYAFYGLRAGCSLQY
jgi:hypothetical protein